MTRARALAAAILSSPWLGRALVVLVSLLLGESLADARPGGGHSYSGGSSGGYSGGGSSGGYSSSGGGGDGGGGALIYLLVRLVVDAPVIGVPLLVAVVGGYFWAKRKWRIAKADIWDSGVSAPPPPAVELEQIRHFDDAFSPVLFEDFLYRLYAEAHRARATGMDELAPYLDENARAALSSREPHGVPVEGVVIAAMNVTRVELPPSATTASGEPYYVKVAVRFETNMTCGTGDSARTDYVVETWSLARAATARTRAFERTRALPCPNCAAPFQSSDQQRCDYCGEVVATGRFDWLVTRVTLQTLEHRPPSLISHAPETGTSAPTRFHPGLAANLAALKQADPAFDETQLLERIKLVFTEVNQAWNGQALENARPFVSDGLYDYFRYWIEAYQAEGLRNVNANAELESYELAKVTRDLHYDAVTVRLWAHGFDYTMNAEGKVLGGSKKKARRYSEYWTFIRASATRGVARTDKNCANCGAPLAISMAGACEYCHAHVTSGEFDWVLSKIEQD